MCVIQTVLLSSNNTKKTGKQAILLFPKVEEEKQQENISHKVMKIYTLNYLSN